MDRRQFLLAGAAAMAANMASAAPARMAPRRRGADFRAVIAAIEAESGGRLGVALHDTGSGRRLAYRGGERFPMCSTFKLLLAGATLARVQQGKEQLGRRIAVRHGDVVGHAPFAARRVGGTASVEELCRAMTVESDNSAANLILAAMGGPPALTRYLRQTGDSVTRLDRNEPTMNEWKPGELRDTTTPVAMLGSAQRLWLGPLLAPDYRAKLVAWGMESRTGLARLRAGLPPSWRAADKTGTSGDGSYNDVAVFWPTGRKPVLISSYLTGCKLGDRAGSAVHANVAMALVATLES